MNLTEKLALALLVSGIQRHRVWECTCGQKNRVDVARVIAEAERPLCGRSRATLTQRAEDVEEFVVSHARAAWARGTGGSGRTVN